MTKAPEGVAAPLEPTPRPIGFCDKERKPHEVKHDCLNWSEHRVSRPKPTQLAAEEAKHLEALISEVGDGYGINPSCCSLLTDDLPDEGSLAGGILRAFELGRAAVSKNLQEELAARKQHIADIRARWGHVEGKEVCQCPICQKDFEAYMDWAEDMSMELHLPGGYKDRAEIAEARIVELEKEIAALREKP